MVTDYKLLKESGSALLPAGFKDIDKGIAWLRERFDKYLLSDNISHFPRKSTCALSALSMARVHISSRRELAGGLCLSLKSPGSLYRAQT